jgi:hypothetical protein
LFLLILTLLLGPALLHKFAGIWGNSMKRSLTLIACIVLLTLNAWSQSTTATREENLVRTVYAQLSYITQVKVVGDAAVASYTQGTVINQTTLNQQLSSANITFTLSDFRTGPLSDIASEKWIDIVTQPTPPERFSPFRFHPRPSRTGSFRLRIG